MTKEVKEKRFFSLNLYETLAIGFLSFISLHVYTISVNQAVQQERFKALDERVLKNTQQIDILRDSRRFPPDPPDVLKQKFIPPDRRKIHNRLLKDSQ